MDFSYYPGCTAHSTGWEFNASTVGVFQTLGYGLDEIQDWNCCGGASAHNLDHFVGLGLPARNLAIAQDAGKDLIIPCAGCYNNVKKAQVTMEDGGADAEKISRVLGFDWQGKMDVLSLVDWLERPGVIDAIKAKVLKPLEGLKVVGYYGCQLVRPQRVTGRSSWENPTVMEAACEAVGATALDWSYKVDCCGADLAFGHGDRAETLCSNIVGKAKEAGADAIVVSCGLCQINLDMRQGGQNFPILYITEVLGEAMQLPGRDKWWKKHITDPSGLFK
ncbi:MAG: CoB--CoM heterodisulfide reductase iron-sulfur subunit B family protein [Deferrisomatales bacterium]|nr:CoB--CoM heterodisulfide reductase iron-sulfur subunit B family protein [Deferrisomatales bacterium]